MKFSNIRAITMKNLNQMKRDPRMILLSIIAPIIITALFGSAFGGDLTHLRVLVVNEDNNFDDIFADEIIEEMDKIEKIRFNTSTSDPEKAKQAVDNNYTQAAIVFPKSFTEDLLLGSENEIELYVSYSNPNVANYVITSLQESVDDVTKSYFGENQLTLEITSVYLGPPEPLPNVINVSLCNRDLGWSDLHDKFSKEIFDILDDGETLDVEVVDSVSGSLDLVRNGEARAIVFFSEEFTYDVLINKEIYVEVMLDGAEPQASNVIINELMTSLSDIFEDTFDKSVFEIDEYYYNNPDGHDEAVDSITYFTPAILGFIVFFFAFILTMLSFLRERKEGTMERILTSPLKRSEIILGYILSFSILSTIQSTVTIIVTILVFEVQIEFTILTLLQAYLIIYLLVLTALGIGIFLSTLAKTEFQIIQFIPLIILPFMLLSGVWAPIETLPAYLHPISSLIPLTYANNAMRDIFLRGKTIFDLFIPIVILASFASLMIFLGTFKLSKTIK